MQAEATLVSGPVTVMNEGGRTGATGFAVDQEIERRDFGRIGRIEADHPGVRRLPAHPPTLPGMPNRVDIVAAREGAALERRQAAADQRAVHGEFARA